MTKQHMKRIAAPNCWHIKKKENKFVIRPLPGAHPFKFSMPLLIIIRDILGYAKTKKEARYILNNKKVIVDGKVRKNCKFLVGIMDVIQIPETKEQFRVLINRKGKLILKPISKDESEIKLSKIINKKKLGKDKVQLNLSDGRNIIVKDDKYKIEDTLFLSLPDQNIKEHIKFEKNKLVYFIDGKHTGKTGKVEEIKGINIIFKSKNKKFETLKKYGLIIGDKKPLISISEEEE